MRDPPDEVGEDAARLQAVIGRIQRRSRPSRPGDGLSPTQVVVLTAVVHNGPLRLSDLAAAEGLNPTLLSRVAAKLEGAGLVRRTRDPTDGRAARLEATTRGRRLQERDRAARVETLRAELASLSDDERRAVAGALGALELVAERLKGRVP